MVQNFYQMLEETGLQSEIYGHKEFTMVTTINKKYSQVLDISFTEIMLRSLLKNAFLTVVVNTDLERDSSSHDLNQNSS